MTVTHETNSLGQNNEIQIMMFPITIVSMKYLLDNYIDLLIIINNNQIVKNRPRLLCAVKPAASVMSG